MKPRELKRTLRAKRRDLRHALRRQRRLQRRVIAQHPVIRERRQRRRRQRLLLTVLILLLLSMLRCSCLVPLPSMEDSPAPVVLTSVPQPPPPLNGALQKGRRAKYRSAAPTPPDWLDEFRLQVSARSPRLANCFRGADKPGAIRWSSSVNAASGAVSDHELEPVGGGVSLSEKTKQCLVDVLVAPAYRLQVPAGMQSTPMRLSIVIEF